MEEFAHENHVYFTKENQIYFTAFECKLNENLVKMVKLYNRDKLVI